MEYSEDYSKKPDMTFNDTNFNFNTDDILQLSSPYVPSPKSPLENIIMRARISSLEKRIEYLEEQLLTSNKKINKSKKKPIPIKTDIETDYTEITITPSIRGPGKRSIKQNLPKSAF
jgi:hypothetical protein